MQTDLYKKVEQFVVEAFTKAGKEHTIPHLKRTVYWLKQFKPDADETLCIAAIGHDIERAVSKNPVGNRLSKSPLGFSDPELLKEHQEEGGKILAEYLEEQGANRNIVNKVKDLVAHHEFGGTDEQNLLKDADSVSYFEINALRHVKVMVKRAGKRIAAEKINWMFERITSDQARKIVRPWYEEVLKSLEQQ